MVRSVMCSVIVKNPDGKTASRAPTTRIREYSRSRLMRGRGQRLASGEGSGLGGVLNGLEFSREATGGAKPGKVPAHYGVIAKLLERLAKDGERGLVLRDHEAIVHPLALASCGHEARPSQVCEMTRDLWLADAKDFKEITDADLLIPDDVQ